MENIKLCYNCKTEPRKQKNKYCNKCHASYMREWRKTHKLTPEQRKKDNARSYVAVYLKRGTLIKQPCVICNNPNSEAHHNDYSKPLEIIWYCRKHHLEHHKNLKS